MPTGLPHEYYNNPAASMGFVGFVRIKPTNTGENHIIRATSANINVSQTIDKPDVIDSRYDRTVYQLGPKEIDGSFSFPAIYGDGSGEIVTELYKLAVQRTASGLLNDFDIEVKYATGTATQEASFTYSRCIANSFDFSVAQSDVISITTNIIGLTRTKSDGDWASPSSDYMKASRVVTWNDAVVTLSGVGGQYIRQFDASINNNAERFYTLNQKLFAQAIAPAKRDVTGSASIMGRHAVLATKARDNQERYAPLAEDVIHFGFKGMNGNSEVFAVNLPNCVYEIEEMSLTNDLFETSVNWHSIPAASSYNNDPLLSALSS